MNIAKNLFVGFEVCMFLFVHTPDLPGYAGAMYVWVFVYCIYPTHVYILVCGVTLVWCGMYNGTIYALRSKREQGHFRKQADWHTTHAHKQIQNYKSN